LDEQWEFGRPILAVPQIEITCELPNKNLHEFSGMMIIGEEKYTLTE
jgi:hypothetical protein